MNIRVPLTLVLRYMCCALSWGLLVMPLTARAAITAPSPDYEEQVTPSDPEGLAADRSKTELTDLVPAPPERNPREIRGEYFHRFRNSISSRLGIAYDSFYQREKNQPLYHLGFLFLFSTPALIGYEVGVDWNADGNGAIHGARRWFTSNGRFRPYFKGGAGIRLVPREALATFVEYRNYQIRAAAGFEHLVQVPMSVRVELEGMISVHSQTVLLSIGYSWAW